MTEVQESAESQAESQLAPDVRPSDVTEPAVWDDPASLRGELFTEEHLIEYAARLAHSHLSVSASSSARPLKKRFRETRGLIQKAYATLAEGAERKRDPSPAEVWLLDNSHVVEGQLREIDQDLPWGYLVKLPRMDRGPMRGYPLVYSLCLCYLRHTDCFVDFRSLTRFVDSYQTVRVLTIGELWAVPIMLRLGLVLAVGALALSEANAEDRDRADAWARRLLGPPGLPLDPAGLPAENQDERLRERDAALRELEGIGADERTSESISRDERPSESIRRDERPSDAFLVTLLKRLRERDDAPAEALAWIAKQTALLGTTPEDLARRYHLRQAADQVSVGNAITSMRSMNNLDWSEFFATTSYVEAILKRDPSGAYAAMDEVSRDRCRHAVERMARRSPFSETQIAEHALTMARAGAAAERCTTHVGYYLIDAGSSALGARVRYRPRLGARVLGGIERHPSLFYLTTIAVLTIGFAALAWLPLYWLQPSSWVHLLLLPAIVLGTSEIATAITNALVVTFVPPRLLPKYRFDEGIPAEHLTLVVVPTLLTNSEGLRQLVEELEVRSLANTDEHLYFALLTDFPDAEVAETPAEAELVEQARVAIAELNADRAEPRYFFFHRRRLENPHEANPKRRFSAWERKRGKLHELNRLLRGDTSTSFQVVSAPRELLERVRYVITLDTDTELPLGVARRLVGALAHPLNRPVVDPRTQRVVRGHAVIQPRVGTSPTSARRSFFARLAAGPPGIDPYTTAVSDVYQDLFGEGTFVGKGIYDVDAYEAAMRGRVPDNQLLSHDLFESIYARSALASDIEVFDEQPAAYAVAAGRQHRWTRGDWQLLPWFRRSVPAPEGRRRYDFRAFDAWRVIDNLRRSLLAPALVVLAALCWLWGSSPALVGTSLILAVFIIPVLGRLVFAFARSDSQLEWLGGLGGDLKNNAQQAFLSLVFLLDQALVSADAIVRSLYRQLLSRQNLLEWTSMRDASNAGAGSLVQVPRLLVASALAALLCAGVALWAPGSLPVAAPFLALWLVSPWVAVRVSRTVPLTVAEPWGVHEARSFRRIARKTWRFFERFVGDTDHHLPPDNYQEDPKGVIAHRTSPTNMGLYLLTVASARDLGFITLTEAIERWGKSLTTLEALEKRDGHVLNWYDTKSLVPLEPRYVSTVDSGNLAGYLWTLSAACREAQVSPLLSPHTLEAAHDAVCLAAEAIASHQGSESARARCQHLEAALRRAIEGCASDPTTLGRSLRQVSSELSRALDPLAAEGWHPEAVYWLEVARRTLEEGLQLLEACLPQLRGLEGLRSALADVLDASLSPEFEELVKVTHAAANLRDVLQQAEQHKGLARSITDRLGARLDGQVRWALEKFERDLDRAAAEARRNHERLDSLAARADALVDQMDFGFLYDEERSLFSIGYNVGAGRLDNSHYDLLASECRLASLVAIAKGDVPQKHWFRLGRLRAKYASVPGLLSWSGSMFEYLMPLLVMRSFPDTLLDQTYHAAIERQMKHAQKFGVPWGISEAAYNVMDLSMNYQYRAFGVPELGLKPGLGDDLVVAPYATALGALVRARAAHENFGALARAGLEGSFGFYESVDYTPARLPPGRKQVVVKAYMAHHQGMTLVALSNLLTDFAMQRRFHADARVKACALLLEERIPARAGIAQLETQRPRPRLATALDDEAIEILGFEQIRSGEVRGHLLGQGEASTWVTAAGDGFTRWRGFDLNRFREDPVTGSGGVYLYVQHQEAERLWSNGYLPTRSEPDYYAVIFSLDKIELQRRDGSIETSTEIVLSPEHPAEIRRVTFTNHGEGPARLDVTAFTELCLSSRAADVSHPAFQKMFVGTEFLEARGALIANRRKRTQHEPEIWVAQMLMSDSAEVGTLQVCTSRADFLGRGGDMAAPQALSGGAFGESGGAFGGRTSGSLDPALVLRRPIELPPGARAQLTLVTVMADSRAALLGLIDLYAARHSIPRAFELAWADARVELRHLNVTAQRAHRYQRLLSAVVYPHPALRGSLNPPIGLRGRDALWSNGISGDLPIVVLRLDDPEFSGICRDVLLAHEYWRLNGIESDLVILNEEAPGYLQPVQEAVLSLIRTTPAEGHVDQRAGVFLRRTNLIADQDLQLLLSAARVVLRASGGSLSRQLRNLTPKQLWKHPPAKPAKKVPVELVQRSERLVTGVRAKPAAAKPAAAKPAAETPAPGDLASVPGDLASVPGDLAFRNAYGGFDLENGDYVLEIAPGQRPPQPWSNVMAGPRFGTLVTEAGSSFTWYENSQKYRLTPWSNDATLDPSGETFFLRDHEDNATWSLTPAPRGGDATYVVRHGQGRSSFTHTRRDLEQTLTVAVSVQDPVKIWHLRLHNRGSSKKTLSVVGLVEWVLGNHRESLRVSTVTSYRRELHAILARNPFAPFPKSRAFFAATDEPASYSADREDFLGRLSGRDNPAALHFGRLSGKVGAGLDPGAALVLELVIEPGEQRELAFVLGAGEDERQAIELLTRYTLLEHAAAVPEAARAAFGHVLNHVRVKTPDQAFDLFANHWLLYQVLSCRFWGRSAFFQSGGAFGYRDQLQDSMALLHARPELTREHLLISAARQFVEGDVQHWWHPDTGEGVRTQCSDDLIWLPWAAIEYATSTGDHDIWNEHVPFLQERLLKPGEDDLYSVPPVSAESAPLYEHCVRALQAANTRGPNGLPLMRAGDWNDGMNRVGLEGRGESVWLGWFLGSVLARFASVAGARGDTDRAAWCRSEAARLGAAIDASAWDGAWYRRATFDDGQPLGSHTSGECRIDAIAQSWAVLSRLGRPERARQALDSSLQHLLDRDEKMLKLLTPPFQGDGPDPGYIAAYPPGIRENGGQYTHGILWTVLALLQQGRGNEAHEVLAMLNAIRHTTDPADLAKYQVEPYVVAADVYSHEPHIGRGGWTWYTGSASWMYRISIEAVLGLQRYGHELRIAPCVPSSWSRFEAEYRTPGGGRLFISYDNSRGVCRGVERLTLDGRTLPGDRVPLPDDAADHRVVVTLGEARAKQEAPGGAVGW